MVNRGDGGGRRPPPGRLPPRASAARPPVQEDDEKTSALNLSDIDLDAIDSKPKGRVPASRDFGGDDESEATSAINLSDMDMDTIDAPAPKRRIPSAPPPAAPAPRRLATSTRLPASGGAAPVRSAPPRTAAPMDEDERTSAINLSDVDLEAPAPRRAPAAPPARQPVRAAAPSRNAAPIDEEEVEHTQAVSMDELEAARPAALAKLLSMRSKAEAKVEPSAADRTFLTDDEPVLPPPRGGRAAAVEPIAPMAVAPKRDIEADPCLSVTAGPDKGRQYPIKKDLVLVGRGVDADCVINDASASRKHFNIVRTLSGWKLVDQGSGNGTKVNGNRVSEIALEHGMVIEAGGTTMTWVHQDPDSSGVMETAPPSFETRPRRTREEPAKAPERQRNPSRLDRMGDLDALKAEARGGAPAPSEDPEKTNFADIAALELDPEWEKRRSKKQRGQSELNEMASDLYVPEEDAPKSPKKGLLIAAASILGLASAFIVLDKVAGLGVIFDNKPAVTKVEKPASEETTRMAELSAIDKRQAEEEKQQKERDQAEARRLVGSAKLASEKGLVIAAGRDYNAALKLVTNDDAEVGLSKVEVVTKQYKLTLDAVLLLSNGKFGDAWSKLQQMDENSQVRSLRASLLDAYREEFALALLSESVSKLIAKDLKAAKAAAEAADKILGDSFEGTKGLLEAIERAGGIDAQMKDDDPATKATPADLKQGLDLYAKGNITDAINHFDGILYGGEGSRADVAAAKVFAGALTTYETRFKLVAENKDAPADVAGQLLDVRRADALLMSGSQKELNPEVARIKAALAKQALEEGKDIYEVAVLARHAVALAPEDATAQEVMKAVSEKAKERIAEVQTNVSSRPDLAFEEAVKALRLLSPKTPEFAQIKDTAYNLVKFD